MQTGNAGRGAIAESLTGALRRLGLAPHILMVVAILTVLPAFITNEYIMRLLLVSLLFAVQAMVFDFSAGFINVVNFGFAGFFGVGGYVSALLVIRLGLSPWLGLIGATIVAGILGLLTGILTLRLRGIYANTMTWFLALTMMAVVSAAVGLTRGKLGLNVPLFLSTGNLRPYYYILLPMAVVLYAIMQRTVNSTVGLAFRAIGQNVDVARASGVDPVRYKVANLAMSCAFAGLLGGYYAHYLGVLTPDVLNTSHSMEVLTLAYIGGRGSLWGGAVAAFLLIPIFEYLKPLMEIRLIIYGLLMILVMIFYPRGIAGVFRQVQARLRGAGKASLWPTGRSKSAKK